MEDCSAGARMVNTGREQRNQYKVYWFLCSSPTVQTLELGISCGCISQNYEVTMEILRGTMIDLKPYTPDFFVLSTTRILSRSNGADHVESQS
jgi:hypothetical protein